MFVTCPSCSTRYQIDATRLGPGGRKVRCTRCKNEWLQAPEESAPPRPVEDAIVVRPPPIEAAAPARAAKPTLNAPPRMVTRPSAGRGGLLVGWLALGIVVLGAIAGLWFGRTQIMDQWPATVRLYAMLGVAAPTTAPGEGLTLQEVKTETVDDNGIPTLVVTGKIVNTSTVPRDVPKMRAALRDASAQELQQWTFEVESKRLLPGESLPFETRTQNPSQDAKGLSIVFMADSEPQ